MDEEPVDYRYVSRKWYLSLGILGTISYVALSWRFPALWGILTASLIVLASGLFTAKFVLGVKDTLPFWTVALASGLGWLLFLWLLLTVNRWIGA